MSIAGLNTEKFTKKNLCDVKLVQHSIKTSAQVNIQDNNGRTLLHFAAEKGKFVSLACLFSMEFYVDIIT